ncbi:hypothetical protein [Prosthecomicrobium pneumaticum]|uniref:Uncharacterized protein n=1 Tax=Prosthecomicrobium pneumaticum TaxID=81895 RepID=A0A7W9L2B2_9HYPH|nr:hypothetical protein [Prosthecomicrobium pneumaticum]MBB5753367.1 hypothetical protein [Prosthecomicrobium pneumaticum]
MRTEPTILSTRTLLGTRTRAGLAGAAAFVALGLTLWAGSATGGTAEAGSTAAAPRGDRLASAVRTSCEMQSWPYIAPDCLVLDGGAPRRVSRTITIERLIDENTSALVRVPLEQIETRIGESEAVLSPQG